MYFPYIRGRQYELIALRELADKNLIGNHVIPIVEPIKLTSTLISTLTSYTKNNKKIGLVHNSTLGTFLSDIKKEKNTEKKSIIDFIQDKNILVSNIVNKNSVQEVTEWKSLYNITSELCYFVVLDKCTPDTLKEIAQQNKDALFFVPDSSSFKRGIRGKRILFEDKFTKRSRNADYPENEAEFFSDDHRYFKDDGYQGFSDFSIIGKEFFEGGFAPYAVAIHLVHFDSEQNLQISHFISDSNQDIQNPAGKFYEAVSKLSLWYKTNKGKTPLTLGLQELLKHHKNETYPGLGTVKKLTLMHHLELVERFLAME